MKILLSAFSCAPGRGSEPNIGWNLAQQVASRHETWVLTDVANQPAITAALPTLPGPRPRFVFVSPGAIWPRLGLASGLPYAYYVAWQVAAFRIARRLQREVGFDLAHHVTFVQSWLPSWLGRLGVPFIWNAGTRDRTPWSFLPGMSPRARADEALRNAALATLGPLSLCLAGRRARLILTASEPARWPADLPVIRRAVGGLDKADLEALAAVPARSNGPFRVLSAGRLLGWKGFHLALEAFARLRRDRPDSEYWIVGDGLERRWLLEQARDLGCADAVRLLGWLPRPEMLRRLAEVDLLVHPSLHEQFGYVVLEAMAAGRPVVCLDVGGPPLVVGDTGICLPARSPEQVVEDLTVTLAELARDRPRRLELGARARARAVQEFSWEKCGLEIRNLYQAISSALSVRASGECSTQRQGGV